MKKKYTVVLFTCYLYEQTNHTYLYYIYIYKHAGQVVHPSESELQDQLEISQQLQEQNTLREEEEQRKRDTRKKEYVNIKHSKIIKNAKCHVYTRFNNIDIYINNKLRCK